MHVREPGYGAVGRHGQGSHSAVPKRGIKRQPLTSHIDLLWSCPTLKIFFLSGHLYIFRGPWVEKKKETNSRVCLSATIVTCWFWKPSDKMFTTQFSSLSLTRSSCPGREASSELNTDSLAFYINPIRSGSFLQNILLNIQAQTAITIFALSGCLQVI